MALNLKICSFLCLSLRKKLHQKDLSVLTCQTKRFNSSLKIERQPKVSIGPGRKQYNLSAPDCFPFPKNHRLVISFLSVCSTDGVTTFHVLTTWTCFMDSYHFVRIQLLCNIFLGFRSVIKKISKLVLVAELHVAEASICAGKIK